MSVYLLCLCSAASVCLRYWFYWIWAFSSRDAQMACHTCKRLAYLRKSTTTTNGLNGRGAQIMSITACSANGNVNSVRRSIPKWPASLRSPWRLAHECWVPNAAIAADDERNKCVGTMNRFTHFRARTAFMAIKVLRVLAAAGGGRNAR